MPDRKQTIILAIQAEVMSQNLYKMLAASFAKRPEVSSVFTSLVPMERIHEEKLTALFEKEFPGVPLELVQKLFNKGTAFDIGDPQKVLEFAINREEIAFDLYRKMAAETTDPEVVKLLNTLASEEENHKIILQTEILRLDNLMIWFDPSELNGLVED
jgi:rubrerythrin